MPRKSSFQAENIVALLNAAKDGGTVNAILDRSGTKVMHSTLMAWVTKGHTDRKNNVVSAYVKFADKWDAIRLAAPEGGPKWGTDPMTEIDKALEMLEEA